MVNYSKRNKSLKGGRRTHRIESFTKVKISKEEEKDTIKPRTKTVTDFITKEPKTVVGTLSKGSFIQYDDFDKYSKELHGETIEKTIHWYRMWFTFLKLCLEYEKKKIKVKNEYVKIDRRFYREWTVNSIPNRTFDNWWKDHRHLFIQEQVKEIKEISKQNKDDYFHVRIPKYRNQREVLKEISIFIQDKMKGDKPKYPFSTSKIQYLKLHQQYNCLILFRNGCTGKQILKWINDNYSHIKNIQTLDSKEGVSRVLGKGRDRLHRTSRGVFP